MIKRVLVTGKKGQLGQSLQKLVNTGAIVHQSGHCERSEAISTVHYEFTFVGRDELDLACPDSISAFFCNQRFDVIINCAAYTAVDKAESEPELANQINHLAVAQLAGIAKQQSIPLIHISTDYVFNGQGFKPYVETDATDPQNVYGLTKLKGEQVIQASGCAGAIIRTSWVYSEFGNNFVKTMLRLGKERDNLNVIFDQIGSPTYAGDLASAIIGVIASKAKQSIDSTTKLDCHVAAAPRNDSAAEIYHYSNEGVCSWYDFAKAIFECSAINCEVNPIETKDYRTPAKRPHFSLMNKAKIKQIPGLVIPYWRDSLKNCLKEFEVSK